MQSYHYKIFLLIGISFILAQSCSNTTYRFLKNYNKGIVSDSLALQMETEIFNLREDILRNSAANEEKSIKEPYYPLGFHLCKGVFLDLNQNLAFDIAELFDINKLDRFVVEEETYYPFEKEHYTVKKEANQITRVKKTTLKKTTDKLEYSGDSILLHEVGLLSANKTITINPEKLVYDSPSMFFISKGSITREPGKNFLVDYPYFDKRIGQVNDSLIRTENNLKIIRTRNYIDFQLPNHKSVYLIKTGEGYLFQSRYGKLGNLIIGNNSIEVFENNKLRKLYILTSY